MCGYFIVVRISLTVKVAEVRGMFNASVAVVVLVTNVVGGPSLSVKLIKVCHNVFSFLFRLEA